MKTVPCPTCKKPVLPGAEFFPFCSDRCRVIDLGRWADEEYRIPAASGLGATVEEDEDER